MFPNSVAYYSIPRADFKPFPARKGLVSTTVPKPSKVAGRSFMFLAGFLMGFVGLFISALGTPSYVTACLRGLFGSAFLTIFFIVRKNFHQVNVIRLNWAAGGILAVSNAATIFFYFTTILIGGFAFGAFMLYTGGIFAVIFVRLILKERVRPLHYFAFGLATMGVATIMEFWSGVQLNMGIITGILSGICLGANTLSKKMYYKTLDRRVGSLKQFPEVPMVLAWWSTLTLGIIFLIPTLFYFAESPFPNMGIVVLFGLIPTAIAFSSFNYGLRADRGGDVLILSYVEPVVATALSAIVGQNLSIFLLLGGAAIIGANILILLTHSNSD
ncbi:MAG: hypothetical protein RBG13Loki_3765 [Promethearchaeota archaeon CR_4]|nr:MAG: hypothetical protein RBG13Loki_3765 [Candidatus Lokiarchaeota archaeon CR_4]